MIDEFNNNRTGWARFSDDRTKRYRLTRAITPRGADLVYVRGAIDCERNAFVGHMRRLRVVFGVYGPGNPAPMVKP